MQREVRIGFVLALCAAVVLALLYFAYLAPKACSMPLAYRVGEIDARFGVDRQAVREALLDAEHLWEETTGKDLFNYDDKASFPINLVYDERQQTTDQSEVARVTLEDKQHMSEQIRAEYERLLGEYESQKQQYEAQVADYEARLARHNKEVEEWNQKGGAPDSIFGRMNAEREMLAQEGATLAKEARGLNALVSSINALGEKGNQAVETYNKDVAWYNNLFGTEREFTQGEYTGDAITIYQFSTGEELRRVAAHEFGHALGLSHVEGDKSLMHYLLEGKNAEFALSKEDLAEFGRVCEQPRTLTSTLSQVLRSLRTFVE